MNIIFRYESKETPLSKDLIERYPSRTFLHELLGEEGIDTPNNEGKNIVSTAYAEYCEYLITVFQHGYTELRQLLLHYLKFFTKNHRPSIFERGTFTKVIEMFRYYEVPGFSPESDKHVLLNIDAIAKRVEHYVGQDIISFLKKYEAYLSGSTLLKAIVNGNWNCDIDIFMSLSSFISFLLSSFSTEENKSYAQLLVGDVNFQDVDIQDIETALYRFFSNQRGNLSQELDEEDKYIQQVTQVQDFYLRSYGNINPTARYEFLLGSRRIDIIICKDNPKEMIQQFDMNFLSSYYDGYSIVSFSPSSIQSKRCKFHRRSTSPLDEYEVEEIKDRMRKYIERGFVIFL